MALTGGPCIQQSITLIIFLFLYFLYLFLGAIIFQHLESEREFYLRSQYEIYRSQFLTNYSCMDEKSLELYVQKLFIDYKNGIIPPGKTTMWTWDFLGSFFFCLATVTTIGYGNFTPNTVGGRFFCVIYSFIGIPLNMAVINCIGQNILLLVQRIAEIGYQRAIRMLTNVCALALGVLFFLLLPPLLFREIEGWTYDESFYFSYGTISTIGYGDFVIGRIPDNLYPLWYKSLLIPWMLIGLSSLAVVTNMFIDLLQHCIIRIAEVPRSRAAQRTLPTNEGSQTLTTSASKISEDKCLFFSENDG